MIIVAQIINAVQKKTCIYGRKKNSCKACAPEKKFLHRKFFTPLPVISNGPSLMSTFIQMKVHTCSHSGLTFTVIILSWDVVRYRDSRCSSCTHAQVRPRRTKATVHGTQKGTTKVGLHKVGNCNG